MVASGAGRSTAGRCRVLALSATAAHRLRTACQWIRARASVAYYQPNLAPNLFSLGGKVKLMQGRRHGFWQCWLHYNRTRDRSRHTVDGSSKLVPATQFALGERLEMKPCHVLVPRVAVGAVRRTCWAAVTSRPKILLGPSHPAPPSHTHMLHHHEPGYVSPSTPLNYTTRFARSSS